MRVKYLTQAEAIMYGVRLDKYPNFLASGSIKGMKEKFYGRDAMLVRCGAYIYNVDRNIYELAH